MGRPKKRKIDAAAVDAESSKMTRSRKRKIGEDAAVDGENAVAADGDHADTEAVDTDAEDAGDAESSKMTRSRKTRPKKTESLKVTRPKKRKIGEENAVTAAVDGDHADTDAEV